MDVSQNQALAAGDLSSLFATIDFTKLEGGVDDDLVDQRGGVPSSGPMNRILVSHSEPAQGRGNSAGGDITGGFRCDPPECTPQFSGRLQPYSVYVPDVAAPPGGYGLVVNLHGANSNHNHFEGGPPDPPLQTWQMLAETGRPSIMAMPNARGTTYFYFGLAAADVFEMWAHVAANYDLDPGYVVQTGSSMGGFGTYKLGTQFPDLYSAVFPNVGINTAAASAPPVGSLAGEGGDAWRMFASLRHVPVLATNGTNDPVVSLQNTSHSMRTLDELGYRYDFWWFAEPASGGHAEYRNYAKDAFGELTERPIDRDPRRVTYVLNAAMHEPHYGITADHAYWLSELELADEAALFGTIDVVSRAFPAGDPEAQPQETSSGTSSHGSLPFERALRRWGDAPEGQAEDVLDITATNVRSVTVDAGRAGVSCDPTINVTSDVPLEVRLVGNGCELAPACPPDRVPPASYRDVDDASPHAAAIDCVTWWGVATGKSAERFDPAGTLTRGQAASFAVRLLEAAGLRPEAARDSFRDDDGNVHEDAINQLAGTGIVSGKAPGRYEPSQPVTRGELATILAGTYELASATVLPADVDHFRDDDGTTHETSINKLAGAHLASGTGPSTFSPALPVARGQTASFLARVLARLVEDAKAEPPAAGGRRT